MKNLKTKLLGGALAIVLATGLIATTPLSLQDNITPVHVFAAQPGTAASNTPTISVSGAGEINMAPDIATVNLGVVTENRDAQEAMRENNETIEAVLAAVRALGIDNDDIRTVNFSMNPIRDWSMNVSRIVGYSVTNTVRVTVRDIDMVGTVLGAGATAGATVSQGVQFSISDSSVAYNQALALAVQNAQGKAAALATALGRNVGAVISVTESGGHHMPVMWADMAMPVPTAAMSADMIVPIETGDLTVRANVQIVFAMN